jgi:hypothetical protein
LKGDFKTDVLPAPDQKQEKPATESLVTGFDLPGGPLVIDESSTGGYGDLEVSNALGSSAEELRPVLLIGACALRFNGRG